MGFQSCSASHTLSGHQGLLGECLTLRFHGFWGPLDFCSPAPQQAPAPTASPSVWPSGRCLSVLLKIFFTLSLLNSKAFRGSPGPIRQFDLQPSLRSPALRAPAPGQNSGHHPYILAEGRFGGPCWPQSEQLSTWNVTRVTEKPRFTFILIRINLILNLKTDNSFTRKYFSCWEDVLSGWEQLGYVNLLFQLYIL